MAKKIEKGGGAPDPNETSVELHVPPKLYARAKALYDSDKELFSEVVKAVFGRDELFGIKKVSVKLGKSLKNAGAAKKGEPKKTCDIGPLP